MCLGQKGVLLVFVMLFATSSSAQDTLAERARQQDVSVRILTSYAPATFEMLVAESHLIVVGTVTRGQTFLIDNNHLFTHYDVTVDQVIKPAQPPVTRGDTVVVRRAGGVTTLEGHNVVGEENDFPQFAVGTQYVLFLQRAEGGDYFWVTYGPQGAFQFGDAGVRQVSEVFGSWNRDRGTRVPLNAFIAEIREAISVSR